MSVTPDEIYTMEDAIKEATGNVLTLGLEMGYYAYMISEKDDVRHITIVEKEQDVIKLFEKYILPQFAHKDKITIIKADVLDYMKDLEDGEYDYCFADTWTGIADSEPYLKLKETCRKFKKTKISYWIEKTMIMSMMPVVFGLIMRERFKETEQYMDGFDEYERYYYTYFENLMKDIEINTPEDMDYYMNSDNILKLMNGEK